MELQIPNYQIEKELGKGGMATVYLAQQLRLKRFIALKVMSAEYSSGSGFQNAFLSEGQIIAQLEHPNIIKIYDIGVLQDTVFYMAMEYLSGGSLRERLKAGAFNLDTSLQVLKDVGAGLQYAHEQGFIHRDIKPENILFHKTGRAILTDFGIAKLQNSTSDMTRMGLSAGTAQYMSPEQATTDQLDERSDLYSLALVVFEMLSGEKVCKADSLVSAIYQHTTLPPPNLSAVYQSFQGVLNKALAKQPQDRYATVAEFVQAFEQQVFNFQRAEATTAANLAVESLDERTILFNRAASEPVVTHSSLALKQDPKFLTDSAAVLSEQPPLQIPTKPTTSGANSLFILGLVGGGILGLLIYLLWSFEPPSLSLSSPSKATASQPESPLLLPSTRLEIAAPINESTTANTAINNVPVPRPPASLPISTNATSTSNTVKPSLKPRSVPNLKGKQFMTTTHNLNLREQPTASSKSLGELKINTTAQVLSGDVYDEVIKGKSGSWLYVQALGKRGYVFNVYLTAVDNKNDVTTPSSSTDSVYVIRRSKARLYQQPDNTAASALLPINTIVFLQKQDKKDTVDGENGQWLLVKNQQGKTGYIFDLDAFPLVRTDPQKTLATVFKFAKGADTGVLNFKPMERRKIYVLGASGTQKISIKARNASLEESISIYVFGDDLSVVANNETSLVDKILPRSQKYYITFHWIGKELPPAEALVEFDLIIKW